jgi:hypothetical protein
VRRLKGAVGRHNCDITNADVGWLLPAEQHDRSQLCRADEGGVAEHLAVLLEADPHFLVNGGADQARRHVDDAHVVLGLRHVHALAEGAHGVLAGVIHRRTRSRLAITDRADVDNRAGLAFTHAWQHVVNAVHHPSDHRVHLFGDLGQAQTLQATDVDYSSVIDKASRWPVLAFCIRDRGPQFIGITDLKLAIKNWLTL